MVVGPSQDAEASVKKFKEKHEITYPLIASCKALAKAYGVELYPTIFVVGIDGKILFKGDVEEPGPELADDLEVNPVLYVGERIAAVKRADG